MAHSTLPVFSPSTFAQLIPSIVGREIARVDRILAEAELSTCDYVEPESVYGACDGGFSCTEKATVHHLETDLEYCAGHFQEVDLG
jgi:hypothetical protein